MTDYKNLKLIATSSPHIRAAETTRSIMLDVIIAMVPALVWAVITFGVEALLLTAVSVVGCVFWEWLYRKLMKTPQSVGDLSAVVTGMLLAFVCPPSTPLWMILIGDFFSIVVAKQLFGGIGKNFANPALVGRIVLFLSFSKTMTAWVFPDAVSSATPLAQLADHLLISTNREQLITTTDFALSRISAIVIIEVLYNFLLVGRPGAKGFVSRHEGLMAHDKDVR